MTIDNITSALIWLVRLGVVARFIFCMVKIMGVDEEGAKYKKRAINAVIFCVLAESVWILKDLALHYYR